MKINLKTVLLLVGVPLIMSVPCALAHTDVTAQQARELIDSTDDLIIVDVREPSEFSGTRGHIPGALNYPWNSGVLQARYEELPIDNTILVVCQSGGRSNQATTFLDSQGFSKVYDMMGGMSAWIWETELCVEADEKYSGGTGEPNDPYQIATAEDLMLLGDSPEDYDKHFMLMADIDLSRYSYDRAVIAPDTNDVELDFQGTPFTGVFDGNSYVISNLHVQGVNYLGLFGKIDLVAKISNLGMEATDVNGIGEYIGSLVGWDEGSISMSYSTGTVSGTSANVGGLVGFNLGSIIMSNSTCAVSGTISVGGLVGYNVGDLTGCYSTAVVSGYLHVGGLVGYSQNGSITTSYSSGTTTGNMSTGGLAGWNWGSVISYCYSTGTVTGNFDVGGLLGSDAEGHVTHCYSTGTVSGDSGVGGLLGYGVDSYMTNCFWDNQTSGQANSDGGTGKTTAEMQTISTFLEAGWDFVGETENGVGDIWRIFEGRDYPRLWWEQVLVDDFEDGEALPLWLEYEPDMSKISVKETGGRLEVYASARADDIDAAYVSNGWRLDVTKDFELKVDFHYGKLDVGDSWVMVGLLPSLAEPVSRIITFEAGCMNEQPFYLYEAINDSWRKEETSDRSSDDGTLYVSYDAAKDELYLSHTGYSKANAWRTVTGLLKNKWAAQPVYVAIGGGSDRVVLDAGDAYLDNFVVDSGVLDFSAEPDDIGTEEP